MSGIVTSIGKWVSRPKSRYSLFAFEWEGRGVGLSGSLLTFSAFRMGAYSRWALIRGWALIRINPDGVLGSITLLTTLNQFAPTAPTG